jgi:multidrug efflux pump subunit AcrA (membrane-fusion protein)
MATTTPPSSDAIELPDCALFSDDVVADDLSDLLAHGDLVRALAEQGFEGAKRLLNDAAQKDPRLAQRIAELRERLRRQASRRVGRLLEEYDRRGLELELVGRKEQERLEAEIAALDQRLKSRRGIDLSKLGDGALLDEVRNALLLPDASWNRPEGRPSFLARLKAFLAAIAAFFRRLFGRKAKAPPKPEGRPMTFATLQAGGRNLGSSEIGDILARMSSSQQEELQDNVRKNAQSKERDLQKEAEAKRRETDAQHRALEAEKEEARRRAERDADDQVRRAQEARLGQELKERGFLHDQDGGLAVTYGLIERFARLVLEEESRHLPGDVKLSLKGGGSTGVYEKTRLRQPEEVAHLDIPSSLLAARQVGSKHIDEATSYVYREITSERVHVVLAFDKSGSMSEGEKLPAAKKAFLALYIAIRKRHPDATIDVVAFDNEVRLLDLLELWECTPGAFTNTAAALRTAHLLLRSSRATRKEVYFVTDGLPEAYTDVDGRVKSGQLDTAMQHAVARAEELATVTPLKFSMILLKSEHPEYEIAARTLTRILGGSLVVTDPGRLGVELLIRWARGTETVLRAPVPEGAPPPRPAGAPGKKRRRADRRMGG